MNEQFILLNHHRSFALRHTLGVLFTGIAIAGSVPAARADEQASAVFSPQRSALYDYEAPKAGTYSLPVIKKAADGEVLTSKGDSTRLKELIEGRITILSFIYLRCASPTACPHATSVLNQLQDVSIGQPSLKEGMQLITLSFDPENDTPEKMAAYSNVLNSRQGAPWHFLTTRSPAVLAPILKNYDQTVERKGTTNDPLGLLYHPVRVYLIDASGQIRNIYSYGLLDPRLILADVQTLMTEQK